MSKRSLPAAAAAAVALLALAAIGALAETVYVTANSTMMFENKERKPEGKRLRLYRGEKLERLKDDGEWSRVRLAPGSSGEGELTEGYVRSGDLDRRAPRSTMIRRRRKIQRDAEDPIFTAGSRQLGPLGTKYAEEHDLLRGKQIVEEVMDYLNVPISDKIKPEDLEKASESFYARLEAFQEAGSVGDFAGVRGGGK